MNFLLDTCVVSELVSKAPDRKVLTWLDGLDEFRLYLSVLTLGELHQGVAALAAGARQKRLAEWIDRDLVPRFGGRILPISEDVATHWGRFAGDARRRGAKMPVIDSLLGATAVVHGLTFATRNTRDVRGTGARVFDPWA